MILSLRREDFDGETLQVRRTAHEGEILEGTKTDHSDESELSSRPRPAACGGAAISTATSGALPRKPLSGALMCPRCGGTS